MESGKKYQYPVSLQVDYSNTREYRQCIRRIFCMDSSNYPVVDSDMDEESKDENEYDDIASAEALDIIYHRTMESPVFQELYLLAAARMFSTEPDIGIAILFSYDYLFYFHQLLVEYFQHDDVFDLGPHPMIVELSTILKK